MQTNMLTRYRGWTINDCILSWKHFVPLRSFNKAFNQIRDVWCFYFVSTCLFGVCFIVQSFCCFFFFFLFIPFERDEIEFLSSYCIQKIWKGSKKFNFGSKRDLEETSEINLMKIVFFQHSSFSASNKNERSWTETEKFLLSGGFSLQKMFFWNLTLINQLSKSRFKLFWLSWCNVFVTRVFHLCFKYALYYKFIRNR